MMCNDQPFRKEVQGKKINTPNNSDGRDMQVALRPGYPYPSKTGRFLFTETLTFIPKE